MTTKKNAWVTQSVSSRAGVFYAPSNRPTPEKQTRTIKTDTPGRNERPKKLGRSRRTLLDDRGHWTIDAGRTFCGFLSGIKQAEIWV